MNANAALFHEIYALKEQHKKVYVVIIKQNKYYYKVNLFIFI